MGKCSGKCDGCKSKSVDKEIRMWPSKTNNGRDLLYPKKEETDTLDSLDGICEHYYYSKVPRSQCMTCIRNWVNSVSIEEAENMADVFDGENKKIAAGRIRMAVKEKQWKDNL